MRALTMLALLGCGEEEIKDTGSTDTGDTAIEDSGTEDSGTEDSGTEDSGQERLPFLAEEVLVTLSLDAASEGPWSIDLELSGDGLFAQDVGSVELDIRRLETEESWTFELSPRSVSQTWQGTVGLGAGEGAGESFAPVLLEGKEVPLVLEAALQDVEWTEDGGVLHKLASWGVPEEYDSANVFGGLRADNGEMVLMAGALFAEGPYPVGALVHESGELALSEQAFDFEGGEETPSDRLVRGEELNARVMVYDHDGGLLGRVESTAMYGDIIVGGIALDDFDD